MVVMTTSLISIGHYQATVGGLYNTCTNMVTCHSVVNQSDISFLVTIMSTSMCKSRYSYCSLLSRFSTKNRKERGEPVKLYHMRNIIGWENLITSGQTNESCPRFMDRIYLFRCESFMADNGTGSTASYSEHVQSVHTKITLTYYLI